ncbi:MAG: RsmB/NOP family class I SAM-dependent RNA methyltransferase, partial [Clostridia bacterium]|nr:RsmB/NOP family class I SAM-dependent RNA methyltransferase [Clostridia bacterium]
MLADINPDFFTQMKNLLKSEYDDYLLSLEKERMRGLRVNTNKIAPEELLKKIPVCGAVPFCSDGFFIGDKKLGNHPYHHAGLFYLQEPSAMLPVSAIAPYLKGRILDLCAAPGGKSTQILNCMAEGSELICNEIVPSRAAVLSSNLERMGSVSAVTSMNPKDMEKVFPMYFDAVIVDAPCSGEGMFRKEEAAVRDWSLSNVLSCAARQTEILSSAAAMLKNGGYMVYSTCTLNDVENEGVILKFLENNRNFSTIEPNENVRAHTRRGFGVSEAMRIFPHDFGEGHFACVLKKNADDTSAPPVKIKTVNPFDRITSERAAIYSALGDFGIDGKSLRTEKFGDAVYIVSDRLEIPQGARIFRGGMPVIKLVGGRCTP